MAQRITDTDLQQLCNSLNELTGSPATYMTMQVSILNIAQSQYVQIEDHDAQKGYYMSVRLDLGEDTIAGLRRNALEIRTRCLREIKRMERIEQAIAQLKEQRS